jgi:hypothetical protein
VTSPGIVGSGFIGVAIEFLPAPVQAAATTSTTGGTLPATSTYKYVVTAFNNNGETIASNEQTVTTGAGGTNSNTVNWAAVTGATGYNIYRTAAGGGSGTELKLATVGLVITYVDTAPGAPSGAYPTVNTANAPGIYTAPTKYFPILNETLKQNQATQYRKPIRHMVDVLGAVQGDVHIDGDVVLEALPDVMPYFMDASRMTVVKTGAGPYTYTGTPNALGIPTKTLSITIVRNGVVFGYTGCCVSQFKLDIANGILQATYSMIGQNELVQSLPTDSYTNDVPFGEGMYNLQLPTGTQIFDADTFSFTVNDNATPEYRMRNDTVGASFVNWGERDVTADLTRDFVSRADYDAYKTLATQAMSFTAAHAVSTTSVAVTIPGNMRDTHTTNLDSPGNVVRSKIAYKGLWDTGTARTYQLVVVTNENMTP